MVEVRRTHVFDRWLDGLKDGRGRARILLRLERLAQVVLATPLRLALGCSS